jgi:mannan endo-1,4-beta-mannosidase
MKASSPRFLSLAGFLLALGCGRDANLASLLKDDPNLKKEIATIDNGRLMRKDEPFRFSATNSFRMLEPWTDLDVYFQTMNRLGINVLRMWGFQHGQAPEDPQKFLVYNPRPGTWPAELIFPEESWRRFDLVIQKASQYGISLIVPLINYWDEYGSIHMLNQWAGLPPEVNRYRDREVFYTHIRSRELYARIVQHTVSRINHLTGIAYKDDAAILFWEPMNEPRGRMDLSGETTTAWINWAAGVIKRFDPNHLVGSGTEGFMANYQPSPELAPSYNFNQYPFRSSERHRAQRYNPEKKRVEHVYLIPEGVYFEKECALANVDLCSTHVWPYHWFQEDTTEGIQKFAQAWIMAHLDAMKQQGLEKPLYVGEFGRQIIRSDVASFEVRDAFVKGIFDVSAASGVAGAAVWYLSSRAAESNDKLSFEILCDTGGTYDSTCTHIQEFGSRMLAPQE